MTAKRRTARPSRAKPKAALPYTVDASVFVNAFNPHEEGHAASLQIPAAIKERGNPVIVPTLLIPENDIDLCRQSSPRGRMRRAASSSSLGASPLKLDDPLWTVPA